MCVAKTEPRCFAHPINSSLWHVSLPCSPRQQARLQCFSLFHPSPKRFADFYVLIYFDEKIILFLIFWRTSPNSLKWSVNIQKRKEFLDKERSDLLERDWIRTGLAVYKCLYKFMKSLNQLIGVFLVEGFYQNPSDF